VCQAVGEGLRLFAASLGERPVGMPLPPLLVVPVALSVAGDEDRRHDEYANAPWI